MKNLATDLGIFFWGDLTYLWVGIFQINDQHGDLAIKQGIQPINLGIPPWFFEAANRGSTGIPPGKHQGFFSPKKGIFYPKD